MESSSQNQDNQLSVNLNKLEYVEVSLKSVENMVDNSSTDDTIIETGTGVRFAVQPKIQLENTYHSVPALNNDLQEVILVKSESSPNINIPTRGYRPSNFPVSPSRDRIPGVNPYRIPPKFGKKGLGANPAGAGEAAKFEEQDICPAPQKSDQINFEDPSLYKDNKKTKETTKLEKGEKKEINVVEVDFDHILDEKGDPVLLILDKDQFIKVGPEQTKTHLRYADDLGINLPGNFAMNHYENLDREGRIEYADKHVSRETIIDYQNEIGKAMTVDDTIYVDGFVGKYKKDADLKISNKKKLLSVVSERGEYISTYGITPNKLLRIVKDGFWIWKNRII